MLPSIMLNLDWIAICITAIIFIWTGFVRSGLGFGGAALGLPFLLFIIDSPIIWMPIIGWHLLFFTTITLRKRLNNVNWQYLYYSLKIMLAPIIIGLFGLVTINAFYLSMFIYLITILYAITWINNVQISSNSRLIDTMLLIIGGYVAGTSLTGAPFIVAVYANNINHKMLRNSLFVLWFLIVGTKMITFLSFGIEVNFYSALALLPFAFIGHIIGLKLHDFLLSNGGRIKIFIGIGLITVSVAGIIKLLIF